MKTPETKPPRLARWLLGLFLRPDLEEEVSGDLEVNFQTNLKALSRTRANLNYWYQVLNYMRPFAIRRLRLQHSNPAVMYKSYFTTSFRSMRKNKLNASINIGGLSVGMAVVMLIALWVRDELTQEKNFENYDRIARVIQNVTNNGEVETWFSVPYPLAQELRDNYGSNFEYVAMTSGAYEHVLEIGDKKIARSGIFAEPDFTAMFSLDMLHGSRDAIKDQSALLISESTAKIYFGENDPVGKVITIDGTFTVNVAGVYRDIPAQSELHDMHFVGAWDLLFNGTEWIKTMADPWRPNAFILYVSVNENNSFASVSANIKDAKFKKVSKELAKKKPELFLFPMKEWHLYSEYKNGKQAGGRIQYVWLFGLVGIFVVLMACINFMNLSTARSEQRAREVGIRKAIGSNRTQLVAQFFSESILTALLSFVFALILVFLLLPSFNVLAAKEITPPWSNTKFWMTSFAFCIVIGLIAGSYPALYLSSLKVGSVIKGSLLGTSIPRKVLVVVQFTISIVLIIGTAIIYEQIQFAKDRPIGYETNGLVTVPVNAQGIREHFELIRDELINLRVITSMAMANSPTTEAWSSSSVFDWEGKDPDLSVDFQTVGVSHDYGHTIGWEIASGRDFSPEFPADSSSFILNESAVRYLQLSEPIGATIRWYGTPLKVVGVVKDIIVRSPYEPVRPMFYYLTNEQNFALLRINPETSATSALKKIETLLKKYGDGQPFNYHFTDESYAKKFGSEERVGKLSAIFTSLAVFISCLGIFGLASYITERRTKEIGVRKVMGANLFQLWRLISLDFVTLVVISCFIAIPLAYWVLMKWLNQYEYRVDISFWVFLFAAMGTLAIALVTVSWHTLRAASLNPVKSLRSE